MPVLLQKKRCVGPCGELKSVTHFWRDASQSDGRMARCKECVYASREERRARREAGEELPRFSLEERKRRSDQAKQMHAEGRIGGSGYGSLGGRAGRPRRPRITEGVLEHFREDHNFQLIIRAFESNLRSNNKRDRLSAAKEIVSMDQRSEEIAAKLRGHGKSPDEMSPEELHELLEQGIMALIESGDVSLLPFLQLPDGAAKEVAA
jgi:alkylated DNA nucleotide flippase Atl1